MRLDIEMNEIGWATVIPLEGPSDTKRFKDLFIRELYALGKVFPFYSPEFEVVEFDPEIKFLVITVRAQTIER